MLLFFAGLITGTVAMGIVAVVVVFLVTAILSALNDLPSL
jgi:hypothetical protein